MSSGALAKLSLTFKDVLNLVNNIPKKHSLDVFLIVDHEVENGSLCFTIRNTSSLCIFGMLFTRLRTSLKVKESLARAPLGLLPNSA